jgi:SAM-dependent methyltransferase
VFDIGTGTGVLALILAQRGAARVVATDADTRAVACARENARRLGFGSVVEVREVAADDPFPPGDADLVVCNPPWLPGDTPTPLDRAVYDPGGRFLACFLGTVGGHLGPGGQAWLILSDLAVRLRLRPPDFVERAAESAGLRVLDRSVAPARPARPGAHEDPLQLVRAQEKITLFVLGRRVGPARRSGLAEEPCLPAHTAFPFGTNRKCNPSQPPGLMPLRPCKEGAQ